MADTRAVCLEDSGSLLVPSLRFAEEAGCGRARQHRPTTVGLSEDVQEALRRICIVLKCAQLSKLCRRGGISVKFCRKLDWTFPQCCAVCTAKTRYNVPYTVSFHLRCSSSASHHCGLVAGCIPLPVQRDLLLKLVLALLRHAQANIALLLPSSIQPVIYFASSLTCQRAACQGKLSSKQRAMHPFTG